MTLKPEELLLAFYGQLVLQGWRDRRSPGGEKDGVHHETGVPLSEADLAPRSMTLGGRELALVHRLVPRSFAVGCTWVERINADGTRERVALSSFPEHTWGAQYVDYVAHLTREIKLAAHRMRERAGWFVVQPPDPDGHPMPLGEDGLCLGIMITPRGLERAIEFARARPDIKGLPTPEQAFGSEVWAEAPKWAREYYRTQQGTAPVQV